MSAPSPSASAPLAPTQAALARILAQAQALCTARGARLTNQRRRVLEVICAAGRPMGAYEILGLIRDGTPAAPPTVYRALDFLQEQGLVHRLATLQAYVGCSHPEHPHASQFLICADCGGVTELEDAAIAAGLDQAAAQTGFRPRQPVIEVLGTCAACARRPG